MSSVQIEQDHPICWELRIECGKHKNQMVSLLHALDLNDFVEGDVDVDIEFDYDLSPEHDYYSDLGDNGPIFFYSENMEQLEQNREQIHIMACNLGIPTEELLLRIAPFKDQNWRESWKASFLPVIIGSTFCIIPPWENPLNFPQKHKIVIDPGMAFGTGQHETTKLCLEMFLNQAKPNRVFDVGAGSGILAIAAALEGASVVLGCDVDTESVRIAEENAVQNKVPAVQFVDTPIEQISDNEFDLVFANIQNKPLRRIFPDIVQRTTVGGTILVSGILDSEVEDFKHFMEEHGVKLDETRQLGHWMGIRATRTCTN